LISVPATIKNEKKNKEKKNQKTKLFMLKLRKNINEKVVK